MPSLPTWATYAHVGTPDLPQIKETYRALWQQELEHASGRHARATFPNLLSQCDQPEVIADEYVMLGHDIRSLLRFLAERSLSQARGRPHRLARPSVAEIFQVYPGVATTPVTVSRTWAARSASFMPLG